MQLNEFNKLKQLTVTFSTYGDKTVSVEVPNEFVETFQIDYSAQTMAVYGSIIVDDQSLIGQTIQFKDQFVDIDFLDYFEERTQMRFRVLNVNHILYDGKQKAFEITLQDDMSYRLKNSYISKSYEKGDLVTVMNEFLHYLGQNINYKRVHGTLEFNEPLIVPSCMNNLDFFEMEILKRGYNICGDRFGQLVGGTDNLMPSVLSKDIPFVENEENQNYRNKIHQLQIKELIRDKSQPQIQTFEFDYENRTMKTMNHNGIAKFSQNDIAKRSIETTGFFPRYDRISSHLEKVRRDTSKSYGVDLVVSGYSYRHIHQGQEVYLQGNRNSKESIRYGNTVNSGLYIIQQIQDRYLQGSLMQKLFLRRPDTGQVLNAKDIQ